MLEENLSSSVNPIPPVDPKPIYVPPKAKFPIIPALIGFFTVIIVAALLGVFYFKTVFKPSDVTSSPESTKTATSSPSASPTETSIPEQSLAPSSSPSSSSPKSTTKPTQKPTQKPVSALPKTTPVPVVIPTLDMRFGNPSANIKQTYDDGTGAGRVINREYTSIQAGQFDEVQAVWSPKVTICYHIVSNEEINGKDLNLVLTLDDKEVAKDNLGQYDKLEAGRIYDWCRDLTTDIGKHTSRISINSDKTLKELIYTNNNATLSWENLPDKIAPNFTLIGPVNEGATGSCLFPQYISDNVTPYSSLKIEQQVDGGAWTKFDGNRYCFVGTAGTSHTFKIKITDARSNTTEQSKTFMLY